LDQLKTKSTHEVYVTKNAHVCLSFCSILRVLVVDGARKRTHKFSIYLFLCEVFVVFKLVKR